jgi:hypothetical protein
MNYEELYKSLHREHVELLEINASLISENAKLCGKIVTLSDKARGRITSMKAETKAEIKAVSMILTQIKDSQSAHWQKKENIRLCLDLLAKMPTFDRGDFWNYEDEF